MRQRNLVQQIRDAVRNGKYSEYFIRVGRGTYKLK